MAQIFLSYARPDRDRVEDLYRRLSDAGFEPWMDKKDILPGEVWKSSIQAAILRSDFFLACLSTNSVTKRGYLQKEIRDALSIWQEMLEGDIYLIPVRLEDCEVPEGFRQFQWVDLFQVGGWAQLVKAIQVGMERRKDITEPATRESMLSELHPVHGNSSASIQGSDIYSSYEAGLDRLLSQMRPGHPGYSEALTYQQWLIENIARSQRYGDTAVRKAARAEIISRLNEIALYTLGISFEEVCRPVIPTTKYESVEDSRLAFEIGPRSRPITTRQEPAEHLSETFAVAQIKDYHTYSPFVMNKEYKLLVGILSNIPAEFVGVPIQLPDAGVVEIDVVVRAAGMEILQHWMQKLRFFRGRDSGLLEFRLTPREVGQKQILIEFYYQRHWLAKIQFDVEVVEMQETVLA